MSQIVEKMTTIGVVKKVLMDKMTNVSSNFFRGLPGSIMREHIIFLFLEDSKYHDQTTRRNRIGR
jgi:hypothetical protein